MYLKIRMQAYSELSLFGVHDLVQRKWVIQWSGNQIQLFFFLIKPQAVLWNIFYEPLLILFDRNRFQTGSNF